MTVRHEEVDILPSGSAQDGGASQGAVQNMWQHHGLWEIRPGFGQLAQFDSGLGQAPSDNATTYGYQDILGSHIFKSDFGHTQILTVLRTRSNTGNLRGSTGVWGYFYAVSIYDVTTGERWEELLHRQTSDGSTSTTPLPSRLGVYETNSEQDTQGWIACPRAKPFYFVEYQDTIFFGSQDAGLWAYQPCDFAGGIHRRPQVDGFREMHNALGYSESSRIVRVVPTPGLFSDGFSYLDESGYPTPTAACVLENRLALAQGRDIYFTDIGRPGSIIGTNILTVPSQQNITALGEANGNLVILTANETWIYRPNAGATISNGQLVQVSSSTGCVGQHALIKAAGTLIWCDTDGIWSHSGLDEPKGIGEAIAPLFDRGLPMPLSSYYQASGATTLPGQQPRATLRWTELTTLSLAYESKYGMLVISLPGQNAYLTLQDGLWAVWTTETVVNATSTAVLATAGIQQGRALALDSELYLVAGTETYTPADEVTGAEAENAPMGSYYILQWRRGGALDRTVESFEDHRRVAGYYQESGARPAGGGYILWGEPYKLPTGTILYRVTSGTSAGAIMYPVSMRSDVDGMPDRVQLTIRFDNTNWKPVIANQGTGEIALQFPPERSRSRFGWGITDSLVGGSGPTGALAEARVYNSATGLVDANGNELRIFFDGTSGNAIQAWIHQPELNLNQRDLAPLFHIPFQRKAANAETMGLALSPQTTVMRIPAVGDRNLGFIWWHYADPRNLHASNDTQQAVDWLLKSPQINLGGNGLVRLRGANVRALTHGRATTPIHSWGRGLFNYVAGADHREWSSQVCDYNTEYPGDLTPVAHDPLLERMLDPPSAERTFNNVATWSDTATTSTGNYLCSDEQVDDLAVSDSIKGGTASVMLFGHVRGRDEVLGIQEAKCPILDAGPRRRTGH